MSGHSHFATIKRQKEAKDAAKGRVFSKMARAISIAVKSGGSADPLSNYKLRVAIEAAKSVNMPKENIERAISRAQSEAANLEQIVYEGFAPGGVGVLVEVATDNRNRTSQEMKNIFERGGGSLGSPGSVSFNFEPKGLIVVKKNNDPEQQMLTLIDAGAEDIEESSDEFELYVPVNKAAEVKEKIASMGFTISSFELVQKPKNFQHITDPSLLSRILKLLDTINQHDDVQNVYSNLDAPQDLMVE